MSIVNRTVQNQVMTESVAPTVNSTPPANGATGISCSSSATPGRNYITVTFIEKMNTTSVTTNTDNTSCSGTIRISSDSFVTCVRMTNGDPTTSDNESFIVHPASALQNKDWLETPGNGPTYKIRVKGGVNGVKDLSGNTMSIDNTTGTGFITAKSTNGC